MAEGPQGKLGTGRGRRVGAHRKPFRVCPDRKTGSGGIPPPPPPLKNSLGRGAHPAPTQAGPGPPSI